MTVNGWRRRSHVQAAAGGPDAPAHRPRARSRRSPFRPGAPCGSTWPGHSPGGVRHHAHGARPRTHCAVSLRGASGRTRPTPRPSTVHLRFRRHGQELSESRAADDGLRIRDAVQPGDGNLLLLAAIRWTRRFPPEARSPALTYVVASSRRGVIKEGRIDAVHAIPSMRTWWSARARTGQISGHVDSRRRGRQAAGLAQRHHLPEEG